MNAPQSSDHKRLLKMLKRAAKPTSKPAIVCYDRKWAGLPRITVYDRPRRSKVGRRKRWAVAVRRPAPAPVRAQMELPL